MAARGRGDLASRVAARAVIKNHHGIEDRLYAAAHAPRWLVLLHPDG
ncbi:hypothetical protein C7S17_6706 [Burkholderia thailandensis]|nr:hypothetical protein [Burkholderia thailandensis]